MKRILFISIAILIAHLSMAQDYQQAINLLKINKRTEAMALLRELQKDPQHIAEASLALSITENGDGHYQESFDDFNTFFKNHPNPYPYIYAIYNYGVFNLRESGNNNGIDKFLYKLIDDPKANSTVKSCAVNIIGRNLELNGDVEGARKMYDNYNDVRNWSTVGVFENISGSGFNKDFGVLTHPETGYTFSNKNNADVKWFDIATIRNDRWMDLSNNHNISDAITYAQTFINSDDDKDVILMIGASGSMKVWLNDFLIASENEERTTYTDAYMYRVKLQKGANRLLLQLGTSEINRSGYMVRIADKDGYLITDVKSSSTAVPYTKAQSYEVKQLPTYATTYFEEELAKHPDDFINQLLLLTVYNRNENRYEAHKILAMLKKMAPLSTLVSDKVIQTARIDNNVVDETKEKEFIKTNDPESNDGISLRYKDAFAKENWDEAISLLHKLDSLYGETPATKIEMINVLTKKKDFEKLGEEINDAYDKYPENENIINSKYQKELLKSKDFNSSRTILDKYLTHHYSEMLLNNIISSDLKTGNKREALNLMDMEIDNSPFWVAYYLALANVNYEIHLYNNAVSNIEKALKISPYNGALYYSEGMIYSAKNDKNTAKEMMKKAVYYSPTNYDAREKLRALEDKKKLADYFIQNDVAKLYKDALANEKYAKEEAVILMNDKRQIVYAENGAAEEEVELLIYINSQTAIQQFKEYSISHNSYSQKLIIDKAELLKKDGSKVPAEKQKGYVVFSSLGIGDAIHLYYRLEDSYGGKLAEHFWNEMYFNSNYPIQTSRYSLIIPASKKFDYKLSKNDLKPKQTFVDDYTMYVWEKNDISKIEPEPMMTNDVYDKLIISSIPDWSYVANWYSDVSNVKTKADFEVKEKVKELMAGNENKTDIEKARIIYDYIENNFNYSNVAFLHSAFTPQRASRTMSTKLGDCKDLSTLFVSMAKEAGLDANLILVRTKGSGDDDLELPTIGFNHCIAKLHASDKDYIIELTNNHLPFSAMASSIFNANGLYIPGDGGSTNDAKLVKLNSPNRPANGNIRETKISFQDDKAVIHRYVYKLGSESANSRYYYKDLDEEEKVKKLTTSVSGEFNKNIKISNLEIKNLDNLSDTLTLDYDLTVDNFANEIVGMKVFRLPWTDARVNEQVFSLEKRKYQMDFEYYTSTPFLTETISVTLPAGKKLAETPKDVSIISPEISYSVKYEIKGDKLNATREIRYLKDMPDEYESVKATVAKINQADSKEIALK